MFFRPIPNPAHGVVSDLSSFSLSRIVLYDLCRHRLLEQEADGISAISDVTPLAKGTYITAILTPLGIAIKKQPVE